VVPVSGAEVLVVGAGPTGLVLALALARQGVPPRVVDSRPGPGTQSRALAVQARTLELYRQLGIADQVVDRGVPIGRIQVRSGTRRWSDSDLAGFGGSVSPYPYVLCFPQDDHEALLVAELLAAGVAVEWQTELVELTLPDPARADTGATVTLAGPDGGREVATVAYVCGCDGARSEVRRQLAVDFAGGTSEETYFVADVLATGGAAPVPSPRSGTFSFCLNRDDFLLVLPARHTGTARLIGLLPSALRQQPDLGFEDVRATAERTTGCRVHTVNWFSTYRVSHRVAERFRVGRAFLLGDAAHIHSPLGGQGMNTGIADAVNLAWKLAAVVRGRAAPALLDSYEPERIGFARALVATTDRLFAVVAGAGAGHRLARTVMFRVLLPTVLQWRPARHQVFRRLSQVRVRYRSSTLSSGRAGRLRGGDRLPYATTPDGDNFTPLAGLDWQLHVYGSADARVEALAERRGLALHELPWTPAAARAGLRRDALYLVRPDGYVAVVAAEQDTAGVERLLDRFAVVPRSVG